MLLVRAILVILLVFFIILAIVLAIASLPLGIGVGFVVIYGFSKLWKLTQLRNKDTETINVKQNINVDNSNNNKKTITQVDRMFFYSDNTHTTENDSVVDISPKREHKSESYKVSFLNSYSYNAAYAKVAIHKKMSLNSDICPWNGSYVFRKEDVNNFTYIVTKESYTKLRADFLCGVVYDLSDSLFSGYAFVLMFDILDSIFTSNLSSEEITNIFIRVSYCCPKTTPYIIANLKKRLSTNEFNISNVVSVYESFVIRSEGSNPDNLCLLKLVNAIPDKSDMDTVYVYTSFTHPFFPIQLCQNFYLGVFKTFIRVVMHCDNDKQLSIEQLQNLMRVCEKKFAELVVENEATKNITFPQWSDYWYADKYNLLYNCEKDGIHFDDLISKEALIEVNRYYSSFCKFEYSEIKTHLNESGDIKSYISTFENIVSNNALTKNVYVLYENAIRDIYKLSPRKALVYYTVLRIYKFDARIGEIYRKKIFNGLDESRFEDLLNKFYMSIGENEIQNRINSLYDNEWLFDEATRIIIELTTPVKKHIAINETKLKEVECGYISTVNALDEYMDEDEMAEESKTDLRNNTIKQDKDNDILIMFANHGLTIHKNEFDAFAKKASKPSSVMLNDINEQYFELLDDNLIEETDDTYYITEENYKIIMKNGRS